MAAVLPRVRISRLVAHTSQSISGYAKARLQYDDSQPISVCRLSASLKVNKQISSPLSPVFVGWLVVNGRNSAWKTFVRSVRRRSFCASFVV